MKRSIFLFLLVLTTITASRHAQAVPAYPHPITVTQSDGTQLTIRIIGDEFNNYTLTQEGYTVVSDTRGDYYYARLNNGGELVATAVRARPMARLTPEERKEVQTLGKALRSTAVSKLRMPVPAQSPNNSSILMSSVGGINPPGRISSAKTTGSLKSLVILVETSDVKFTVSNPQQAFNALLNQDGYSANGATGSAWNYYHANSNGQFNPDFVVIGPYQVSNTMSHYAGQDGSQNVAKMLVEACQAASNAGINFSQYADNGIIRDVFLFFPGHNQAEGAGTYTIWPHRGGVYSGGSFNGVRLQGYACSSEYRGASGRTMAPIGTFCHEFGHVLGWPDFYDTDYGGSGGDSPALENLSLMCSGSYNNEGRTPPALNILERWMMGWATPEELSPWESYTLAPVTSDKGYLVRTSRNNDYFLFEYRGAGKTAWDNPSHIGNAQGLMAYHVDYNDTNAWLRSNTVNANPSHENMKLVRSVPGTTRDPKRTIFPGVTGVTMLSSNSNRDYQSWIRIAPETNLTNITLNTNTSVSFSTIGNTPRPDLKFKVETSQRDAALSWEDTKATSWKVTWKKKGSADSESQTVTKPELHISGLSPTTEYEVAITPQPEDQGTNPTQNFLFTTQHVLKSAYQTISLTEYEYSATRPILFAVNSDEPATVKWYVDGQLSTSTYRLIPVGEHKISAEITAQDGTKEYIIKYILVK